MSTTRPHQDLTLSCRDYDNADQLLLEVCGSVVMLTVKCPIRSPRGSPTHREETIVMGPQEALKAAAWLTTWVNGETPSPTPHMPIPET